MPRDARVVLDIEDIEDVHVDQGFGGDRAIDYFAEGTLLAGVDAMSAADASARLAELGICHEFSYSYPWSDPGRGIAAQERWCSVPPVVRPRVDDRADGGVRVTRGGQVWRYPFSVTEEGYVMISVADLEPRAPRLQPPAGWDCPTD